MSFILKSFSEETRQESLLQILIELSICCGVLFCIVSLSAFLATSAILGFLTVSAFLLALGNFSGLLLILCQNKKWVDGLLFFSSLIIGFKLGVIASASLIFAGIFFSLYLRWGESFYPKKETTESFLSRIQRTFEKFRTDGFWKHT